MSTVSINIEHEYQSRSAYTSSPYYQPQKYLEPQIIEGFFPKENTEKEMAIRKVNTSLCIILGAIILLTSVSYYFATASEMQLNDLSRQTTVLNDENTELQNKLDKLKSFNNVDMTMQKNNLLQKAEHVIEVSQVNSSALNDKKINTQKPFTWAIGY